MDIRGPQDFDLLVIGGGAIGTAIARDAAGRGGSVCVVESGDLAADIRAGPERAAVEDARSELVERERLRNLAPHLVEPVSLLPQDHRSDRPRWLSALLPARSDALSALHLDAERLVVLTALDAAEHGAQIRTRTDCAALARKRERWTARLKGPHGVEDIIALQVVKAGDAEALEGDALRLDRGWDGRAPALLYAAEDAPMFARARAERALTMLGTPGLEWTATAPLPGGDIPGGDFDAFLQQQGRFCPWLRPPTLLRMARAYGTRLPRVLGDARSFDDLGVHFGNGLTAAEVIYLIHHEYARSADDVLLRRSRLALHLTGDERSRLIHWFERTRIDDEAINAAILAARAG